MTTFVSVGNATQPFTRLVEAVRAVAQELPQPIIIQHGHTEKLDDNNIIYKQFMGMDEFANLVASSTILIMHAGAGSILHAIRAGKIPIVMPRLRRFGEHVDDHQVELAEALHDKGKVLLVLDKEMLLSTVRDTLTGKYRASKEPGGSKLLQEMQFLLSKLAFP